jgi:hypothetical protein
LIMSSFINFPANDIISFSLWLSNIPQYTFIHILSIHQLGRPSPIVFITQSVMVKELQLAWVCRNRSYILIYTPLGAYPGVVWWSHRQIHFYFLRNLHGYFHSGWKSLHSHQQYMRFAFSLPIFVSISFCFYDNCKCDWVKLES